jgi:hypothetical protein
VILRERPLIKLTVEGFRKYRDRQADIAYLAANLSMAMSLLEGDIPKPIRDAIIWAEGKVDTIRFGFGEERQYDEVQSLA